MYIVFLFFSCRVNTPTSVALTSRPLPPSTTSRQCCCQCSVPSLTTLLPASLVKTSCVSSYVFFVIFQALYLLLHSICCVSPATCATASFLLFPLSSLFPNLSAHPYSLFSLLILILLFHSPNKLPQLCLITTVLN